MDNEALDTAQADQVFTGQHDRRKVTDWVCEEIREAIIDLRLHPGEPLREAAIAQQLGVSKTPIREALARLEQEGLVEVTSFKGAVVSGYSPRDLEEIYELRSLLEGAAVRGVAVDASEEARAELCEVIARSRELRDAGELTELATLLGRFDRDHLRPGHEPADPRVDRQPPRPPDADRQAHRGHPRPGGGVGRGARRHRRGRSWGAAPTRPNG